MQQVKRVLSWLFSLALLASPAVVLWQRQALFDWWRLKSYNPPAAIVELAANVTMNGSARRVFYATHPELNDKFVFNTNCPVTEHSIVLGCFIGGRQRIHILQVTDERLRGVHEVTAAHELLHAVYDRLSPQDKQRIDQLLNQTFEQITDQRIKADIEAYRKAGDDVTNELHSILGTEVRKLPTELEDYYKRYFDNRSRIVDFAEDYKAVFLAQKQQIQILGEQIKVLERQLSQQLEQIKADEKSLNAESDRLNQLLKDGRYSEYNAALPAYNAKVDRYRASVRAYNAGVTHYKELIRKYNELAVEQRKLNDALDSRAEDATAR